MNNLYKNKSKHLVAVDCIIFGYDTIDKEIKLLLIKRNFEPAKGLWSLAGGFLEDNESLDNAAARILENLTGLKDIYLRQMFACGEPERDPGGRVISVAYFALIKLDEIDQQHRVDNSAHWRSFKTMPDLIFDHQSMVEYAYKTLRQRVKVQPIGFKLLPEKFTLVQLQDLYEAIYQRKMDKRNFRKKILSMNLLDKLEEKEKETSKKGAFYYSFKQDKYEEFIQNGFYFNLDVN